MTSSVVLDAPTKTPEKTTVAPEIETVLFNTVGGTGGSSLIITENPSVFGKTGLLVARRFEIYRMEAQLFDADHYRIDQNQKFGIGTTENYRSVAVTMNKFPVPHVRMTANNGNVLPLPSTLPYQLSSISSSQYDTLKNLLGNEKFFQLGAEMAFQIAAANSHYFRYRNGKLEMPREYASLRI
ncbi:MAG: hypothetical protein V1731_02975 [Candidatus Aenigmatarchaeota archaeon]